MVVSEERLFALQVAPKLYKTVNQPAAFQASWLDALFFWYFNFTY